MQNNSPVGRLLEYLRYQARHAAKQVVKFEEKDTKTCSSCDYEGHKSVFKCSRCGLEAPRDVTATLNQTKLVAYGTWHALKAIPAFSSIRTSL